MNSVQLNDVAIIECQNAVANIPNFRYTGKALNFSAYAGEIVNIIGPDYSGKSAWTRMLCGIDPRNSGDISILSKPLHQYTRNDWIHLRKNVAFIKEDTALLSAANGLQNVLMPAMYHHIDNPANIVIQANKLLADIIPGVNLTVLPAQLRKDQRYLIAVARALILRPVAIVLDSPFESLDTLAANQFKRFLLNYSKNNNTLIIVVSHDIKFALKYSDKIIFASKEQLDVFDKKHKITDSDNTEIAAFLKDNS